MDLRAYPLADNELFTALDHDFTEASLLSNRQGLDLPNMERSISFPSGINSLRGADGKDGQWGMDANLRLILNQKHPSRAAEAV